MTDADPSGMVAWLAERDVPCPACGYNLRGLRADRCPECGRGLRLGLSLAEPFLRAWVALLVALLLPAGFGLVLICGFLYGLARFGAAREVPSLSNVPVGPALVVAYAMSSVPLSAAAVALRRRFLRRSTVEQVVAAAVAWAALAGTVLYLLAEIAGF